MGRLRSIDLCIVIAYVAGLAALGLRFSRRQTSTETYFVAKRSIPAWAMGVSLLGTLITSVTFIAYPGSAYAKDWSLLVAGTMVVAVLFLVGFVIIPFYREAVRMSAFEYIGWRFGHPARVYASLAFALGHLSKMAFVVYLLGLTVNSMTGWPIETVIVSLGFITIVYTWKGGIEGVIWTDVVQGFVLWAGVLASLGCLLYMAPGGPSAVFRLALEHNKFSLGDLRPDLSKPTVLVLLIYGFFWYVQKYTADQTVVQRYLVAKSDRGALRGVALGACLCLPVWSLFMLVGTCTWAYFRLTGEALPKFVTKADQVFPYFVSTHLPPGAAGFFVAALFGAAMCSLASDLNSFAVVGVEDIYRRLNPRSGDASRLRAGRLIVGFCGAVCIGAALLLARMQGSALAVWYTVSAITGCGLVGLFLLAFLNSRTGPVAAYCGIAVSLLLTAWAAATLQEKRLIDLGRFNFPWHDYMIGAVGNLALLAAGFAVSLIIPARAAGAAPITLWSWMKNRRLGTSNDSQGVSTGCERPLANRAIAE